MSEIKENKVDEETSSEAKDTISSQTVDDSKNTSTESSAALMPRHLPKQHLNRVLSFEYTIWILKVR